MANIRKIMRTCKFILMVLIGKELNMRVRIPMNKLRLGSTYGGWNICPNYLSADSIVYSFGIGEDISFDLELIKHFGCNIYAFDPTTKSLDWLKTQSLPKKFNYYGYGIADFDGLAQFFPPDNPEHVSHTILYKESIQNKTIEVEVHKLTTIMDNFGHSFINLLKMDIEGAEYSVLEDLIKSDVKVRQLLIEFHHRFPQVGLQKTKKIIKQLNNYGYELFAISDSKEEYSFIKVN